MDQMLSAKANEIIKGCASKGTHFAPDSNNTVMEAKPNLPKRDQAFAELLIDALKEGGDIDSRCAITQRMMRSLSEEEKRNTSH